MVYEEWFPSRRVAAIWAAHGVSSKISRKQSKCAQSGVEEIDRVLCTSNLGISIIFAKYFFQVILGNCSLPFSILLNLRTSLSQTISDALSAGRK